MRNRSRYLPGEDVDSFISLVISAQSEADMSGSSRFICRVGGKLKIERAPIGRVFERINPVRVDIAPVLR